MIKSEIEKNRALAIIAGIEQSRSKIKTALNDSGITDSAKRDLILGQTDPIAEDLKSQLAQYDALKKGDSSCLSQLTPGQKLIAIRIFKGLTQSEVADKLSVSQAAINKDERNEYSGASFEKLSRVAAAIGCHIEVRIEGISMSPNGDKQPGKDKRVS